MSATSTVRPYLVMALVDGATLGERLERERLDESEVVELGVELLGILAAVHDVGLVHRDVKPDNVIIDERGRVHVVDFGLVAHLSAVPEPPGPAGTRHYAAPEQLRTPQLADGRADLYAVGRILADCLAHRLPSAAAKRVLDGLLAEDPDERYRTARAARRDLERVRRGGEPHGPEATRTSARPPTTRFVGRDAELRQLEDAWVAAAQGNGRVVLLEGPAGSGKSRTIRELCHIVRRSGRIELGTRAGSPMPLAAVRELFETHLGEVNRLAPDERAAARDRIRGSVPSQARPLVASVSPQLAELLGAAAGPAREQREPFAESVAATILRLAHEDGPLLVHIDDAPALDPLSREVLARVAVGAANAPLLFVLVARTGEEDDAGLERFSTVLAGRDLLRVQLGPLSSDEIAIIAADYLGVPQLDAPLRSRIVSLAEGTPLGVLELVGALVDGGALRPQWGDWGFDRDVAERIQLPRGATGLLARRIDALPAATLHVLRVAALLRMPIARELIAQVCGIEPGDVGFAFNEASRAGLFELTPSGEAAFVHGAVTDGVLAGMPEEERRELHRRIASTLGHPADATLLLEAAHHLDAGYGGTPPAATIAVAYEAAERCAAGGDHDTAVRYHAMARRSARAGGTELDARAHRLHAESLIQIGALEESLPLLAEALRQAEGLEPARVLARTSWVHQAAGDEEQAWSALGRAFEEVGQPMPTERPRTVAKALAAAARSKVLPARRAGDVERLALLCELHYQNGRLGVEYAKPARTLQSALAILDIGRKLPPSGTLARAHAMYGVFMGILGRVSSARRHMEVARAMATRLGDPAALGIVAQLAHVQASFAGDIELALHHARTCLDDYGAWVEVGDFCHVAGNARLLEAVRGRPVQGLAYLHRAVARARRRNRTPAALTSTVLPLLRSTLETMGREDSLEYLTAGDAPEPGSLQGLRDFSLWGPRATSLVERGELGPEFETLVHAFRGTKTDPRRAHPVLAEYYISVAHGRALQRFGGDGGGATMRDFDHALADLKKVARLPLFKAHWQALRGVRALCVGDARAAREAFIAAEELGSAQQAPWVLYTAARGMAHLHRTAGNDELALASAQLAAKLAREHEAPYRLALIEAEFALERAPEPRSAASSSRMSSSRISRQLRGVVGALRLRSQEAGLEAHSHSVLDEVIKATEATRGVLHFMRPGDTKRPLTVARTCDGSDWDPGEGRVAEVTRRLQTAGGTHSTVHSRSSGRSLSVPLVLFEQRAGTLLLERDPEDRPFSPRPRLMC